jgi:polyisoprenoid-binding protein YceI
MKNAFPLLSGSMLAFLFCCATVQAQPAQPGQPAAVPAQPPQNTPPAAQPYTLDLANSMIQFYVNARLTNVKGVFRSFQVAEISQTGGIPGLRGRILIDTASVFTREKKRDEHLRADDFFWSDKFPQAAAAVKSVVPGAVPDQYQVTISLRIRDKEKDFVVPTRIVQTPEGITASGEFTVDRTYYDLTGEYLANKVMDDEALVSFKFVLIKVK